jgi:uncharacterized protein YdaU (DUF1376 family)
VIWYKFHIGDYLTHTAHLNEYEDLVYRRLLDLCYMSEAPLPLDTKAVARKVRLDLEPVEQILEEFFTKTDDGYINNRATREIAKYQAQARTNREIGARGGRPKKTETVTENNPNQIQIQKKDISSKATRFAEFWSTWPASKRKVGKAAVEAKWKRHNLDAVADKILMSVRKLKNSDQWTSGFEPAPMTYINQRRWEDENDSPTFTRRVI